MDSDDFEELPKRAASAKGHTAMDDDAEEASDGDSLRRLRVFNGGVIIMAGH